MMRSMRRAQLLADTAFDLLMWNDNGDGTTYTERPITERERARVTVLTALSNTYAGLAAAEAAEAMVDANIRALTAQAATATAQAMTARTDSDGTKG